MQLAASDIRLSPTDLSAFLGCRHRTGLDLGVLTGQLNRPAESHDPVLEALRRRGAEHEAAYVENLRAQNLRVVEIATALPRDERVRRTVAAMRDGADVIVQAALEGDAVEGDAVEGDAVEGDAVEGDAVEGDALASPRDGTERPAFMAGLTDARLLWAGYADILRRVDIPSPRLGVAWSYEPWDTKLARDTRGGTILQLAVYVDLLEQIQGVRPARFHVVSPGPAKTYGEAGLYGRPDGTGDRAAGLYGRPAAAPSRNGDPAQLTFVGEAGQELRRAEDARFVVHTYRHADFAAYIRVVRRQLDATLALGPEGVQTTHYPDPVEQCDICQWWDRCDARRRTDDHLGYVAGIATVHREELRKNGIATMTALAAEPPAFKPKRGSRDTYERLHHQARLQVESRRRNAAVHELLPVIPGEGLCRLPAPSPGDVFLDLEGARFAREGGREYLFGMWTRMKGDASASPPAHGLKADGTERPAFMAGLKAEADGMERSNFSWTVSGEDGTYLALWAFDDAAERAAFETLMDRIADALRAHPDAHIYHYAPYEPAALKRLMGRYATRAEALDELLRGERFVDLHAVVRQALRVGEESYSIKRLERHYGFTRAQNLRTVTQHLQAVELALESGATPPADWRATQVEERQATQAEESRARQVEERRATQDEESRATQVEAWRATLQRRQDVDSAGALAPEALDAVQAYNADDCRSAAALRDWLEQLRDELLARGETIPRPTPKPGEASKAVGDLEARQQFAREKLLATIADPDAAAADPHHPDHPRWLMAYLLDWHRREDKTAWWEYYRLRELPEADLLDERAAIAGLQWAERVEVVTGKNGKPTGSVVDRYRYPEQETDLGRKGKLEAFGGERIGELVAHDRGARIVDIRKGPKKAETHPTAVFECDVVPSKVQQEALLRLADRIDEQNCGTDLLFRRKPRLLYGEAGGKTYGEAGLYGRPEGEAARRSGPTSVGPSPDDEEAALPGRPVGELPPDVAIVDHAISLTLSLDRTTLAIQGPPGSGKTYVGAQMIRALVRAGKKVGVTATSHKVIRNLLNAVAEQEAEADGTERPAGDGTERPAFMAGLQRDDVSVGPGLQPRPSGAGLQTRPDPIRLGHKCDPAEDVDGAPAPSDIREIPDNGEALAALASGEVHVLGATPWLWSRPDATLDVLFVDEAGQLSLANALAVSGAARSLVLLGDPQQLEQPQKGSHPDGVGVSALEHVLGGAPTMPPDRGLFLPTTWRLHPALCAFTSALFYEGKLTARAGLERQALVGTGAFDGAGLWWVPVAHEGNTNASDEEVDRVEEIVRGLLAGDALASPTGQLSLALDPDAPSAPSWTDASGTTRPLTAADILVVAPYNAHVNRLTERLAPLGVHVGTVDKFQGQQAPVVIYAMATSRPEDAPRGMEFLYSLHRLNVATSRARCAAIVVASPRLMEPVCRTPRQMVLANAVCDCVGEGSTIPVFRRAQRR